MSALSAPAPLRIGELAAACGLTPKTIRYYEQVGIVRAPSRSDAGYRLYGASDIERLRFILRAKALGLTLREIGQLIRVRGAGEPPCAQLVALLDHKLADVEERLRVLRAFRADLQSLRAEANGACPPVSEQAVCGVIAHHAERAMPSAPSAPARADAHPHVPAPLATRLAPRAYCAGGAACQAEAPWMREGAGAMTDALLVVDVQNDFCPGGALAVPEGDAVVPVLNAYIARAAARGMPIYASRDWHPRRTTHFAEFGGPWPVHCVRQTPGAAFHPALRLPPEARIVTKGTSDHDDGYSAFEGRLADGRSLAQALREAGVTRVYVGGLATDYCVRASVLGALAEGFAAVYLRDAARGVELHPGDSARAEAEMRATGARETAVEQFTGQ